ncbi:MAG: adenosine kinase [Rhabdochlamydiaceae bacterium]|nr:adenosine kinase [Candidatus Amphrikana amoebophyrae]
MAKIPTLLCILFPILTWSTPYDALSITDLIVDHCCPVSNRELHEEVKAIEGSSRISEKQMISLSEKYGDRFSHCPGGSATNIMKGLSLFGHKCAVVGKLGQDEWSNYYLRTLARKNLDILFTPVEGPTAQSFCLVDPSGLRSMLTYFSPNLKITSKDLDPQIFNGLKLMHVEGYAIFQKEVLLQSLDLAKQAGAKIAMDLSSYNLTHNFRDDYQFIIKSYVDILFANVEEAQALTGIKNPKDAALKIAKWCNIAVVHMGSEGGFVANGDKFLKYQAFKVEKVVDNTGAGDLFACGFLHSHLNNEPLHISAMFGASLGAAIVQVKGTELPPQVIKELSEQSRNRLNHFNYKTFPYKTP